MKKGDKLYCHKNINNIINFFVRGEVYTILSVYAEGKNIIDNNETGGETSFSVLPDNNGLSYKTWFYSLKEYRKIKLKNINEVQNQADTMN